METKWATQHRRFFLETRIFTFTILLLTTISIGDKGLSENSIQKGTIRNLIASVTNTYSESDSNYTTVLSTDDESLSMLIHPTVSYVDTEAIQYISDQAFSLPHMHFPNARWGPFFEEGSDPQNITARLGSTVTLDCKIGLLHDKTVTWLHHKENSIHLLTVARNVYSSDERITLSFRYPNNWRLVIVYVTERDEGLYECQVATHPPKVKRIFLRIIAPVIFVVDDVGREITERYYKEGSTLELTCLGIQVDFSSNATEREITWRHGDNSINKGIRYDVSQKSDSITSTLVLAPIKRKHSGNYTCSINGSVSATVAIHVLNGDSPAAVQLGNNGRRNEQNFIVIQIIFLVYEILR